MAWNTGVSYGTSTPIDYAVFNGIGADLRSWGGNVDAAGSLLTGLAGITGPAGASPVTFATNGSERMRISGAGNVGINKTAPTALLDVAGNASITSALAGTFDITASISNTNVSAAIGAGILRLTAANTSGSNAILVCIGNTTTVFSLAASGNLTLAIPSSNPGAGTKQLWYDPADGNRVKFAA